MNVWQVKRRAPAEPENRVDTPAAVMASDPAQAPEFEVSDRILGLKVEIHQQLLDRINLAVLDKMARDQIVKEVADIVGDLLTSKGEVLNRTERTALCNDVLDELL